MDTGQRALIGINVLGGMAVLGTYAWGFVAQSEGMDALWGGVPEAVRPIYTANMLLSALGYFLFTPYIVFRLLPRSAETGRSRTLLVSALYLAILIPSALWLPLTFWMVEGPSPLLWAGIRVTLAAVAVGAGGLLVILLRLERRARGPGHGFAVAGLLPFCLQTVVLDAVVWPLYFTP